MKQNNTKESFTRYPKTSYHGNPPFRLNAFLEMHLSQCPESSQGHVPARDVEAERVETSVPGILIQHYLVFSLSQSLPLPSNQNNLKLFPFGKAACIVDVCQWLTSGIMSAQKHFSREVCVLNVVFRSPLFGQIHSGWVWDCAQVCCGTGLHWCPYARRARRNSPPHRDAFTWPHEVHLSLCNMMLVFSNAIKSRIVRFLNIINQKETSVLMEI